MAWNFPFVIAHRCASQLAPENTIAALKAAKSSGAEVVECDVQLTQDGIPVIFHDDKVNRTTNLKGWLHQFTFLQLMAADAGSWFSVRFCNERVPVLVPWLQTVVHLQMGLNVELKSTTRDETEAKKLVDLVLSALMLYWKDSSLPLLISSFNYLCFCAVASTTADYPLALNSDEALSESKIEQLLAFPNFVSVHHSAAVLTESYVHFLHQQKLRVLAYTVNTEKEMRRLKQMGVDGVFTDNHTLYQFSG